MIIKFDEIDFAFSIASAGGVGENEAYIDRSSGKIYWYSAFGDNEEELPDDIDDEKYLSVPHKNELGLGKPLVMDFAREVMPEYAQEISDIFNRKGAYAKFRALLESTDYIDQWYAFETAATDHALREWCNENNIEIEG